MTRSLLAPPPLFFLDGYVEEVVKQHVSLINTENSAKILLGVASVETLEMDPVATFSADV